MARFHDARAAIMILLIQHWGWYPLRRSGVPVGHDVHLNTSFILNYQGSDDHFITRSFVSWRSAILMARRSTFNRRQLVSATSFSMFFSSILLMLSHRHLLYNGPSKRQAVYVSSSSPNVKAGPGWLSRGDNLRQPAPPVSRQLISRGHSRSLYPNVGQVISSRTT